MPARSTRSTTTSSTAVASTPALTEVRLEAMTPDHLNEVLKIEQHTYAHPWSRGNFADALRAGYPGQLLMAGDEILGYMVAMRGFEEVHLLNITVAPAHQGQGWGRLMLEALAIWSRGQGAQTLWLEVRQSNARAIRVYEVHGYHRVGLRRGYYPDGHGKREDAVVMSLQLNASASPAASVTITP
jgi:ribosomal-protein-alanine N-acetyltransferase